MMICFFFSSRRRHTRFDCDWSSDVCSSDLEPGAVGIDTGDVGVRVWRHADVAGRADVEVELAIGPEGQVLPAVRQVARQDVIYDLHVGWIVEPVLDPLHHGAPGTRGDSRAD